MLDLNDLRAFEKVAGTKNFSSAARALGLPRSSVSRAVARLESELGARLFQRTTREVALTSAGEALRRRCAAALGALDEAVEEVRGSNSAPRGLLRVTAFASHLLSRELPVFLGRYPGITVALDISSEPRDLVADVDVAIRLGPMPDSGLVSTRLRTVTRHLCVSPSYLEQRGMPESLDELVEHDIVDLPSAYGRPRCWTFVRNGETKKLEIPARVSVNEESATKRLVVNGAGIGVLSGYCSRPALASGELVELFPDWSIPAIDVNIVFASKRELAPNVRVFVDFMKERLGIPSDDALRRP